MNNVFCELIWLNLIVLFGKSMSDDECVFMVTNSSEKKVEFNTFLTSGIKMIYIEVIISDDKLYANNSNYNIKQESGLFRWVWTKTEMSFLLSYTEDIHAISFDLLKGDYIEDLTIYIDIFPEGCAFDYRNDTHSLFYLLHDTFVQNESDWQLCHRYFENQEWKVTLFNLTSYWVGYGMECFKPSCRTQLTSCDLYIEKSFINYLIIIFLIGIFIYSPVLLYFFPEKISIKNIENRLQNYNFFDTPYSVSRLLLNLNKQPHFTLISNENKKSFVYSRFALFGSIAFSQENKILTIFVIVCSIINIIYRRISTTLNEDWKKYEHIYLPYDIPIPYMDDSTETYLFIYFIVFGFCSVCISIQIRILRKIKNVYFIFYVWQNSIMKYIDIDKLLQSGNENQDHNRYELYGYTFYVLSILNRVALLFTCAFYVSLLKPLRTKIKGNTCKRFWKFTVLLLITLISLVSNIFLCAFPIICFLIAPTLFIICTSKNFAKKFLVLCFCVANAISAIMVIRYLFISALSILLRFIIFNVFIIIPTNQTSFKFWSLVITVFSYLRIFYKDFYDPYNELLKKCISFSEDKSSSKETPDDAHSNKKMVYDTFLNKYNVDNASSIKMNSDNLKVSILKFQIIANTVYPIRIQIAFLIAKLLCLSVIITVIAHVMTNDVGGDSFIDQYLPLILFTVTPAVAMKLNNTDPNEHVEKYSQFIKETMEKREERKNESYTTVSIMKKRNPCTCCKSNLCNVKEGTGCEVLTYSFLMCFVLPFSFYLLIIVVLFSIKDCFSCKCISDDKNVEDKQYAFLLHPFNKIEPSTSDKNADDTYIVLIAPD